jgi:predicted nucleic acid-binding protein
MILVDSNVPMYLVGAKHPHKADAQRLLDDLIAREERLVTDVEVLQEILHRYTAIARPDAIQPAFDAVLGVVDEVFSLGLEEAEEAKRIVLGGYGLSADAIHVAAMRSHGVRRILSFDTDFGTFPGIERVA